MTTTTPEEHQAGRERHVWFLSPEELAATRVKLAALTRRATRNGFAGRVGLDAQPATRSYPTAPGGPSVSVHGFEVTITGEPPCFDGWRFVAAIDTVGDAVVARYPPGRPIDIDHTSLKPGCCDHCHTTRDRRTTVLVEHETTGELKQVGRSCLKDFLGWSTLPVLIDDQQVEDKLQLSTSTGRGPVDLASVLTFAWAAVAAYGWTSSSAASEHRLSTRELVAEVINGGRRAGAILERIGPYLAEGERLAPQIIADLTTAFTAASGYQANMAAILRAGQVDPRHHLGLAVSAVNAWQRLQQPADTPTAAARTVRSHAGSVGEQVTLTGTVTTTLRVEGYHWSSPDNVLLILDCEPHVAKLVTAASWAYEVEQGDVLTVTGRVKAHATYRDVPQTVLVRPRLDQRTASRTEQLEAAEPEPGWEAVALRGNRRSRFPAAPLAAPRPPEYPLSI